MTQYASKCTSTSQNAPSPDDLAAFRNWLSERYLLNPRDDMFRAALGEILASTPGGDLTASPLRFDLINETRGILVYGQSASGKTALIRRNLKRIETIGIWADGASGRAFSIRVPPEATLKGLATEIAKQTGYSVAAKMRTTEVWEIALHRLAQRGITILWIDEVHHLLGGKEAVEVLQRLKSLMQGDQAMALIVSGIPLLDGYIRRDPETERRFVARVVLRPISTENERSSLRAFFQLCCKLAGLQPPTDPHVVERLEAATHGSFGGSIELFQKAVYWALRRGEGRLTLQDFRHPYDLQRGHPSTGPFDQLEWPELKDHLARIGWAA